MTISAWIGLLAIPLAAILFFVIYYCYMKLWRWRLQEAYRNHRNRPSRQNSSAIYSIPIGITDDANSIGSQKTYGSPRRCSERPPSYEDAIQAV